jgi:hypothetical protein
MAARTSALSHILNARSKMIWWSWMRTTPSPQPKPTNTPSPPPKPAGSRSPPTGPTCIPVTPSPAAGYPAPNKQPNWAGRAPTVGDFAPAELGCVLRISDGSASRLIGDALDLRHRLPSIWAAAQAGQVPAYQARRIASATRQLTAEQAATVDQRVAGAWVRCGGAGWRPCSRRPSRQHRLRPNNLARRQPIARAGQLNATASRLRPCG